MNRGGILKDAAVSYRSALRQEEVLDVTSGYQVDQVDEAQETLLENGLRGKRILDSRGVSIECCTKCHQKVLQVPK